MPTNKQLYDAAMDALADSINTKAGTSGKKTIPQLKTIVDGISVGVDTSDATATADKILSGYSAYGSAGTKLDGTIPTRTSSDLQVLANTVSVPSGYYASSVSKSVASGSVTIPTTLVTANPSISVSNSGLITTTTSGSGTVTPTVSAGYVSSVENGSVSVSGIATSQLSVQAAQTITPTTTDQTIASGKYLTGAQTVEGIVCTNLSAGNIKKDVVIKVGTATDDDSVTTVTGTYEGGGGGYTKPSYLVSDGDTVSTFYFNKDYSIKTFLASLTYSDLDPNTGLYVCMLGFSNPSTLNNLFAVDLTSGEYAIVWNDGTTVTPIYASVAVPAFSVTTAGWQVGSFTPDSSVTVDEDYINASFLAIMDSVVAKDDVAFGDHGGGGKAHTFQIPTITGTYTYTGSAQTPTITGYYADFMTKSGDTSATSAGSHTITFALKDTTNCQWSDGTTTNKAVSWSIAKATLPTPTLSKASILIHIDKQSDTFTVSRMGDGAISAVSDNPTKITASVSGTVVTVTAIDTSAETTATIAVSVAEGTNYLGYTGLTMPVKYAAVAYPAFENASWADLKRAVTDGVFGAVYGSDVGKTKTVTLTTDEVVEYRLSNAVTELYDYSDDSGKSSVVFEPVKVLSTTYPMMSSGSYMGWGTSTMYSSTMTSIYNTLPSDLKSVVAQVKLPRAAGSVAYMTYTNSKLFLAAEKEIKSTNSYSESIEFNALTTWEYYKTSQSLVKKDSNNTARAYWLSTKRSNNMSPTNVTTAGNVTGSTSATTSLYIAPCFCL